MNFFSFSHSTPRQHSLVVISSHLLSRAKKRSKFIIFIETKTESVCQKMNFFLPFAQTPMMMLLLLKNFIHRFLLQFPLSSFFNKFFFFYSCFCNVKKMLNCFEYKMEAEVVHNVNSIMNKCMLHGHRF